MIALGKGKRQPAGGEAVGGIEGERRAEHGRTHGRANADSNSNEQRNDKRGHRRRPLTAFPDGVWVMRLRWERSLLVGRYPG